MKFPQGEGSAVIHRKKNRPALQRRDILTVSLVSSSFSFFLFVFLSFGFCFLIGNLLKSSSTQCLVVLFFSAFYTAPFSSRHYFFGLFLRSLSTKLFFWVVLLPFVLSMTAFSYVRLLSLFWVRLFQAPFLSHLLPSSYLYRFCSQQFAELGSIHINFSFFSYGLFFVLPMFIDSVLRSL